MSHPVDIPHYGSLGLYRAPWRFSDLEPTVDRAGPRTGEHNAFVFGEILGLSTGEIERLSAEGVIA